jgi:hypothetical protein
VFSVRNISAVAAGAALLAAPVAEASSSAARLTFDREVKREDCPDERAFRALVTARLGHDPFVNHDDRVVNVEIHSAASGIVGHVDIREDGNILQERTVRGGAKECEAVVEAIASIVALSLTPEQGQESGRDDGRSSEVARAPDTQAAPTSATTAAPSPRNEPASVDRASASPSAIRFAARGAIVSSAGLLPGLAIGGEAGGGFAARWFSLYAMGRGETQAGDAEGVRGQRLDGSVLSGGVAPCFSAAWFTGCGTAWLGVLQGRAPDAERPSLGSSLVGFVGARLGALIPLGAGLRLAPQVEAWVATVRTTLVYAGAATWTAPALLGSTGLGLVYVPEP